MSEDFSLLGTPPNMPGLFGAPSSCTTSHGYYRSRIYTSNINLNPLIGACDQLLNLATIMKTADLPDDRDKLLQDLAHEIHAFEHQAQIANYSSPIIIAARYALCSLLDEAIALTPWGQNHNWSDKNLLSLFYNENYGGNRFFSIIDHALENITNHLPLIELLYLCLNLGFSGKYQEKENGESELLAITNKLYQIIGRHNHHYHKNLLIDETKCKLQKQSTSTINLLSIPHVTSKKFWIITLAVAVIISFFIYLGISFKLNQVLNPIYTAIKQIQNDGNKNYI